jgi:uncharacterized protein (TIGR02270 family)
MLDPAGTATLPDVLEEHLEELAFLWEQRERFIDSPDWTLESLQAIEERAEAHLDGLRLGAGHSAELARPALIAGEIGVATAATFVLMSFGLPELENEILRALATAPPEGRNGIRVGLRHCDIERIGGQLSEIAVSGEPSVRAAAVDILAFHRFPPPKGIATLLGDPDPEVRRLAFEAAGRFGGPWSYDIVQQALDGEIPALRVAALRASARMGLPGLDDTCRRAGTRPQSPVPEALEFLGVLGDPKDLAVLQNSISRPDLAPAALAGLGALGSVAAIPALIDAMADPALVKAAGRGFVRITAADGIEAEEPLPPPEGLSDAEAASWDTSAPPDPAKARTWWDAEKGRFDEGGRWQCGRDVSKSPLGENFDGLTLASRLDVYLGERARDPRQTPDRELERSSILRRGPV